MVTDALTTDKFLMSPLHTITLYVQRLILGQTYLFIYRFWPRLSYRTDAKTQPRFP